MKILGPVHHVCRPCRGPARRAVAAALALAFVLVAVEVAQHHDSTCDRHQAHHTCAICVAIHAPGLPASAPVMVAVVHRAVGRPAAGPAPRVLSDAARGAITPRSPPHAA